MPAHDLAAAASSSTRSSYPDPTRKVWEGHSPLDFSLLQSLNSVASIWIKMLSFRLF